MGAAFGGNGSVAALSRDKLALLYRVMDTNNDGRIDVAELVKFQQQAVVTSQDSQGDMENLLEAQRANRSHPL